VRSHEILYGSQRMAKVHSGEEIVPDDRQTDDRQTDEFAIAKTRT